MRWQNYYSFLQYWNAKESRSLYLFLFCFCHYTCRSILIEFLLSMLDPSNHCRKQVSFHSKDILWYLNERVPSNSFCLTRLNMETFRLKNYTISLILKWPAGMLRDKHCLRVRKLQRTLKAMDQNVKQLRFAQAAVAAWVAILIFQLNKYSIN